MAIQITSLLASPRAESSSTVLARDFGSEASKRGAEVSEHRLASLDFSGCQYLAACKTSQSTCGLDDDATDILAGIASADVVVMATPVWFTGVSSHLKKLIDRMFSFLTPDYATAERGSRLSPGKHLVFIQVQGEAAPAYADMLERHNRGFNTLGFAETHHLYAAGVRELADLHSRPELRGQAAALAETVMDKLSA